MGVLRLNAKVRYVDIDWQAQVKTVACPDGAICALAVLYRYSSSTTRAAILAIDIRDKKPIRLVDVGTAATSVPVVKSPGSFPLASSLIDYW